jgi:hypothetical protein
MLRHAYPPWETALAITFDLIAAMCLIHRRPLLLDGVVCGSLP